MDSLADDNDVRRVSDQIDARNVLVDNGILVIEELKPPDKPQDRELRDYVDKSTRSIQPATGDQVVYRLKEAGAAAPSGVDDRPQVAVLGSSQVPVGLSSALGYLQLGQRARVKVPAELMQQAVDDTDAALHALHASSNQHHTPASTSQTQPPRKTPAAAAPSTQPTSMKQGSGVKLRDSNAAGVDEGFQRHCQAPAAADPYTGAAQAPDAGTGGPDTVEGVSDANEFGGVVPPALPPPAPEQQTLRQKYQPQQHQGVVAALAAKYQQQSATNQPLPASQKGYLATDPGNDGSSVVIRRADSDHSSWIPDSRASSRTSHEAPAAPAAASGHSRVVHHQPGGSRPVMTHRMPSASGWTSGASSPRSDDSASTHAASAAASNTAFHTPGGTSYHSAVSTPASLTQRQSSSNLDDNNTGPLDQPVLSSSVATDAKEPGGAQKVVTSHVIGQGLVTSSAQRQSPQISKDLPHALVVPRATGGSAGFTGSSLLGSTGGAVSQLPQVRPQKQLQQGLHDDAQFEAAQSGFSGAINQGTGAIKPGPKVSSAYQTPDQVLQAAARKLELEQHQHPRLSFDSMLKPVDENGNISSRVSSRRAAASRAVGGREAAPAGPAAAAAAVAPGISPGTHFTRVSSDSSDGVTGHQSGTRSGAPSFKTWIPGRTGSTSESTAMVAVAEEDAALSTAAATSGEGSVVLMPHQQSGRPSVDRKMRYSGDYGSFRQSSDQEVHTSGAGVGCAATDGAAEGIDADAGGGDQDNKKEYELEVLAIIPGRGKMSGKPVLSAAAARQQENLDIDTLAREAADAEPQFKPPKPHKGLSGWVRRHLSLNLRSPASAGKRGLKWLGIRDCFSSSKGQQ